MIFVECKPDMALIRSLGVAKKEIQHSGNKSGVCRKLFLSQGNIGLVDQDPGSFQMKYLQNLNQQENVYGIKVFIDNQKNNRVIMLCTRLENWILVIARKNNIDVRRYNLPDEEDRLHKKINSKLDEFEQLLADLSTTREMQMLHEFINV